MTSIFSFCLSFFSYDLLLLNAMETGLAVGGLVFLHLYLLGNGFIAWHIIYERVFSWFKVKETEETIPLVVDLVVTNAHVVLIKKINHCTIKRKPLVIGVFFILEARIFNYFISALDSTCYIAMLLGLTAKPGINAPEVLDAFHAAVVAIHQSLALRLIAVE